MKNLLCNEEIVSQGPISLLTKTYPKPQSMPVSTLDRIGNLSDTEKILIKRIGINVSQLESDIQQATMINFERSRIYKEVDRALLHWMVGSSMELYADYATTYSTLHNASVWITSKENKYSNELNSMLERIGIEERIFDWAHTVASYGDMFTKVEAQPTLGVVSVCDDEHPINISRVDNRGVLIGFFETPLGLVSAEKPLLAPWEYVHFRILGSKRKRPLHDDPMYSEYRTIHLMAPDTRRVSASYGCSLIMNALPVYKRLRLAEDSLLLARLTRGVMKYIYKVKVDSTNIEAVSAILDEVATTLKRARALDINENTANYDSKSNPMACLRGDTYIHMCDGEASISIQEIVENKDDYIGKSVWSVNPNTREREAVKITRAEKTRENTQLVRVHIGHKCGYVDCTPDHLFMLSDSSYTEAQNLEVSNLLMTYLNRENVFACGVLKVEWLTETADTYDITVEKNHNFALANGVFVHNSVEDIVIPVWNDANDLTIDKIGGEADIKWIVDIEELRNQLASALRTPLSLLGGFVNEATGALGSSSIEKLDIRFARSARRLQRSLKEGIKRICQIHLAHMNMDPDPIMFEVNMSETSSAEEEQLKDSLNTGMDVISKAFDIFERAQLNINKPELMNYFNKRILKLNDIDFKDFIETGKITDRIIENMRVRKTAAISDLRAHLPSNNGKWKRDKNEWKEKYGKCKVIINEDVGAKK